MFFCLFCVKCVKTCKEIAAHSREGELVLTVESCDLLIQTRPFTICPCASVGLFVCWMVCTLFFCKCPREAGRREAAHTLTDIPSVRR